MKKNIITITVALFCWQSTNTDWKNMLGKAKESARSVGEKIESAATRAGKKIEAAAEKTGATIKEAFTIDWNKKNHERADKGDLPKGTYLDYPGLGGCGWGSPTEALAGAGIVLGTAAAEAALTFAAASTFVVASLAGVPTFGLSIKYGMPIVGKDIVAMGDVAKWADENIKKAPKLTRFLTCTVTKNGQPVTSSVMTSLDEENECTGDIKINSEGKLKCTKWRGPKKIIENMEEEATPATAQAQPQEPAAQPAAPTEIPTAQPAQPTQEEQQRQQEAMHQQFMDPFSKIAQMQRLNKQDNMLRQKQMMIERERLMKEEFVRQQAAGNAAQIQQAPIQPTLFIAPQIPKPMTNPQ